MTCPTAAPASIRRSCRGSSIASRRRTRRRRERRRARRRAVAGARAGRAARRRDPRAQQPGTAGRCSPSHFPLHRAIGVGRPAPPRRGSRDRRRAARRPARAGARSGRRTAASCCGCRCSSAARRWHRGLGGEALEMLEAWRPDVLVSDSAAPRARLLRAGRQGAVARSGPRRPHSGVALTAWSRTDEDVRRMLSERQRDLPKPVEPAMLTAEIARLTGRERRRAWRSMTRRDGSGCASGALTVGVEVTGRRARAVWAPRADRRCRRVSTAAAARWPSSASRTGTFSGTLDGARPATVDWSRRRKRGGRR